MQKPQLIREFSLIANPFLTNSFTVADGEMKIIYQASGESEIIVNNNAIALSVENIYISTFPDIFEIHCSEGSKTYILSITDDFFKENQIPLSEYCYEKRIFDSYITQTFNELIDEYSSNKSFSLHLSYYVVVTLIVYLTRIYSSMNDDLIINRSNPIAVDRVKRVIKYIEDNFNHNITIKELASLSNVNVSKNHLIHEFKMVTGLKVNQVKNIIRLRHVNTLLLNSERSISDISEACGFNHYSHFYKMYKNTYGISPNKYRKQFYNHK